MFFLKIRLNYKKIHHKVKATKENCLKQVTIEIILIVNNKPLENVQKEKKRRLYSMCIFKEVLE